MVEAGSLPWPQVSWWGGGRCPGLQVQVWVCRVSVVLTFCRRKLLYVALCNCSHRGGGRSVWRKYWFCKCCLTKGRLSGRSNVVKRVMSLSYALKPFVLSWGLLWKCTTDWVTYTIKWIVSQFWTRTAVSLQLWGRICSRPFPLACGCSSPSCIFTSSSLFACVSVQISPIFKATSHIGSEPTLMISF